MVIKKKRVDRICRNCTNWTYEYSDALNDIGICSVYSIDAGWSFTSFGDAYLGDGVFYTSPCRFSPICSEGFELF
jgi:hypothetical protein